MRVDRICPTNRMLQITGSNSAGRYYQITHPQHLHRTCHIIGHLIGKSIIILKVSLKCQDSWCIASALRTGVSPHSSFQTICIAPQQVGRRWAARRLIRTIFDNSPSFLLSFVSFLFCFSTTDRTIEVVKGKRPDRRSTQTKNGFEHISPYGSSADSTRFLLGTTNSRGGHTLT